MAKFHIEWIADKPTSTGKARAMASLKDESGNVLTDVTLWGSNWPIATFQAGMDIEGIYEEKQNGQYLNKTLNPIVAVKPAYNKSAPKAKDIEAAQVRTSENVKVAQENKMTGVEVSATFRDATQIALAQLTGQNFTDDEFKDCWLKWRGWLSANFDPEKSKRELGF